jgi:hypothetical protein
MRASISTYLILVLLTLTLSLECFYPLPVEILPFIQSPVQGPPVAGSPYPVASLASFSASADYMKILLNNDLNVAQRVHFWLLFEVKF